MNNKGFTLIELIATIALLAVISAISVVSVSGVIKHSKVTNCENLVKSIKSAVNEYVSDNRYSFSYRDDFTITGEVLIDGKYLVGSIINPFNDMEIDPRSVGIEISLNSNYTFKDAIIKVHDVVVDCEVGIE